MLHCVCDVVPYSCPHEETRKGLKRPKGDPTREVVERPEVVATARPRDRRDCVAW